LCRQSFNVQVPASQAINSNTFFARAQIVSARRACQDACPCFAPVSEKAHKASCGNTHGGPNRISSHWERTQPRQIEMISDYKSRWPKARRPMMPSRVHGGLLPPVAALPACRRRCRDELLCEHAGEFHSGSDASKFRSVETGVETGFLGAGVGCEWLVVGGVAAINVKRETWNLRRSSLWDDALSSSLARTGL